MIILQCIQISKSFGVDEILSNIKLEIHDKDRIALVGRNGAGKSTLLKIIAGELSYDSGDLIIPNDIKIGYLAQDSGLSSNKSIWEEMNLVFSHLKTMEKKLRQLEMKMAEGDTKDVQQILKEYDLLQQTFKEEGGYQYEADIRSVLAGLGFSKEDYDKKIDTLSGGQKTRLALGKLLLSKPNLLVLDEPTNHLDMDTLTWLEGYLSNYDGAIFIVSHDRYFLDRIVDKVYELSNHKITRYIGNYSNYLEEKAKQYERDIKKYEKQQDEVKRLEDFIQRNIARASTTRRAQSRRKQLQRMNIMDRPFRDDDAANFSFQISKQSGNDVLTVENLTMGYEGEKLFENINLKLSRGDSVALIGPNGIGKSTLIKGIAKKLAPMSGSITYGTNVTIGYYDQEQRQLTSNKTVLNELWDEYPHTDERTIRTVLGNFLFSGDDVLKIVSELSGGEKARLALAKLMMQKANLLILDEPTNHLDINSKEVLEAALLDYPGTILFVSHDRYFINRIANKVVELSRNGIKEYLGDYDYYVMKKQEEREWELLQNAKKKVTEDNHTAGKQTKSDYEKEKERKKKERQLKRKIEEIEQKIDEKEAQIKTLEEELFHPDTYHDHEKSLQITNSIEELKNDINDLLEQWEKLYEKSQ